MATIAISSLDLIGYFILSQNALQTMDTLAFLSATLAPAAFISLLWYIHRNVQPRYPPD